MELVKNLMIDSVARLLPAAPLSIRPEQTVRDAVHLMRRERTGCLLVCSDEHLVGILTERDILKRVLAVGQSLDTPVSQCMTANPTTVALRESVGAAVRRMEEGGHRHLPVVESNGKPVGILSVKRIVHYFVEHFPKAVFNLPPDPAVVPQSQDGA